ncbi:MAG: substrate-binding domain-containing protein [Alicyclobacillus sp.]|nr:substrate-binding domain-containing protein [Alicyclobacillus sp.]
MASSGLVSASAATKAEHFTFEFIPQASVPFYISVQKGLDDAATQAGNISIRYEAPSSMTDLATQLSMFNSAVASHVDGIILAPQSPKAFVEPIKKAIKAGIPVICVDTGVTPNVASSYIATSNTDAAKKLAVYMASLVHGKGTEAVINFNHSSSTAIERQTGWEIGMKAFPKMRYLGAQLSNDDPGQAQSEAQNFYQRNPNINIIFGTNDLDAVGAANFVKRAKLKGKLLVAGFDADAGEIEYVKQGYIAASVLQYPYEMGRQAVEELLALKAGKHIPKVVYTKTFIVTPQNVNSREAINAISQYIAGYHG